MTDARQQNSHDATGVGPLTGRSVCCLIVSDSPAYNGRLIKVAEAAASAGAAVSLVCLVSRNVERPEGPFRLVWLTSPQSDYRARVPRVLSNVWRELVGNPLRLARAAWRADADVYHAHFLPTLLPAIVAARLRRARVVFDARDLFVEARGGSLPRWIEAYYRFIESHLIARAHAVLAVSEPMARVLEERFGAVRTEIILNGAYEHVAAADAVHSPVRLLFQGAFAHNRNLASLVGAMRLLKGRATLTLQGWGDAELELHELILSHGLTDSVDLRARCEPKNVIACAGEYDVGVIAYRADTLNLQIAVPNKLLDYVGAGLAVAASDLPGHRSIIEGYGFGVLIDPTSDETLARDLGELVSDPERIARMKAAAVEAAPGLSWAAQAEKLLDVYVGLVGDR